MTNPQSLSERLRYWAKHPSGVHDPYRDLIEATDARFTDLLEAADALDAATVDTTKLNAGQLVQRIMRAMDGDISGVTTASLAEHIAAEILNLPKDYWRKPSPPPPPDLGTNTRSLSERLREAVKSTFDDRVVDLAYEAADALDTKDIEIERLRIALTARPGRPPPR